MKSFITFFAVAIGYVSIMEADDRPVTFAQLPSAAQSFINANFPEEKVSYSTKDDDFIRPDYKVVFVSGTRLQFDYAGALEKVSARTGVPEKLVPVQILEYVKVHFPDAFVVEYEIDRKSYEVKLSNRLELKFNKNFNIIEIDD